MQKSPDPDQNHHHKEDDDETGSDAVWPLDLPIGKEAKEGKPEEKLKHFYTFHKVPKELLSHSIHYLYTNVKYL